MGGEVLVCCAGERVVKEFSLLVWLLGGFMLFGHFRLSFWDWL